MSLQIKCDFIASKEITYGNDGKSVTKFWVDIDKDSKYPTQGEFQTFKSDLLTGVEKGDPITVHFEIKGRKWEKDGKNGFGQNLIAWRLDREAKASPAQTETAPETDDLPF